MIKLVWTNWGSNLAIGVYASTRAEAEQIFNGCFNYGAVTKESEFHILKDGENGCFGYFKSTWKDLLKVANIPYIAPFLPKTQEEIDTMREDFLDKNLEFEIMV